MAKNDNIAETVGHNGSTIQIRRYLIGGKTEYRFHYRDNANQRHARCCRTLESARKDAKDYLEGRWNGRPAEQVPQATERSSAPAETNSLTFTKNFEEVCKLFLTGRKSKFDRREMRYASYRDALTRVDGLKGVLGDTPMSKIDVFILDQAMRELGALSPRSLWNYRNMLGTVLRWAVSRDHAPEAAIKAYRIMEVTGSKDREEEISPFTPKEVGLILEAARTNIHDPIGTPFKLTAVVALQAFAGLRAAEACRLQWQEIDLERGIIRVKRIVAKVKAPRMVPMTDNLRQWLALVPGQMRNGPIYSGHAYSKAQGRLAARVAKGSPGFEWKDNGLRSGFISHFIAFSDSLTETAFRAGTSERKIRDNYWKLVTPEAAKQYFSILPPRNNQPLSSQNLAADWCI